MAKDWDEMTTKEKLDSLRDRLQRLEAQVNGMVFDTRLGQRVDRLDARMKQIAKDVQELREQTAADARS